ncbi:Arc family DNA-binding protein [Paracoccus yeei]|uniref:Arc family DNA-binding protein n=1 Tax=Paracoccus yeei TaxID=147645 RepID=A0A386UID6_9RHOB|nr:Arc family DNA-binding protein [Paracoccus yeei]AYF00464.1 Arc family DNA-binding protein [Paracoccus yeei]AZV00470.1 Arc-like DNA-binding domain-containing protein [Paracoccus phage vB_PyeM_Pyei1]
MSRKGYPSDKQDQFMLRLPDGMRDRIKVAAERNNRSMNAEIVASLEEKYPAPTPEEEHFYEVARWSDRIASASSEEEVRSLAKEANEWLSGPGASNYRIFLFKPSGSSKWLPSIVPKDAIREDGMPLAFSYPTPRPRD